MLYSQFKSLVGKMREAQDTFSDAQQYSQKARDAFDLKTKLENQVDAIVRGDQPQKLF